MIKRENVSGKPSQIYKSEVIDNNLNPEWKPFTISVSDLTAGNMDSTQITLEVFDEDVGSADLIGKAEVITSCLLSKRQLSQSCSL